MIAIATTIFDLNGTIVLHNREATINTDAMYRRMSKSALLDGGVWVVDGGFSHGDRDFTISINEPSEALVAQIKYLMEYYPLFTISTAEGVFHGMLGILDKTTKRYTIKISIESKEA